MSIAPEAGEPVYIGLGSNLEPERHLRQALNAMRQEPGLRIIALSPVYQTAPWGVADQPDFLNAVLELRTTVNPVAMLDWLLELEKRLGRVRLERWGPRTLDLDVLAWGNRVINTPQLEIPHPRLHQRGFVLVPFCDLAPQWRHPILGRTARDMLKEITGEGVTLTEVTLNARL
ncbi:MAG: 2-amino-4-hydroxy-6-hydroxymethyldihydropteridine diphosphokinase [Deltaproteobacteria bacterium]|nr:2-amino-4-hydroxy-6-hydroxymethyldihydropteridine diphosphokinase [Deltaproteobacteria bacterium]